MGRIACLIFLILPAVSWAEDLRLMKVRHATFVAEVGGQRILVDPNFANGMGAPGLITAEKPVLDASDVGAVEFILVTTGRMDHFHKRSLQKLKGRDSYCLVPDDETRKRLQELGFRRVRRVQAGDRFKVLGLIIHVSPAKDVVLGKAAVGYRVQHKARSLWFSGPLPGIQGAKRTIEFAETHASEIAVVPAGGTRIEGAEVALTMGASDGYLLAALAKARRAVAAYDQIKPHWMLGYMKSFDREDPLPIPRGPRFLRLELGVWHRFLPPDR